MKQVIPILSCLLFGVAAAFAQTGFSCMGQIIDQGTPARAVLEFCGEPTQVAEGSDEIGEGVAIPVEEWLYRYVPMQPPSILIFRNGVLSGIRMLDGFPPT